MDSVVALDIRALRRVPRARLANTRMRTTRSVYKNVYAESGGRVGWVRVGKYSLLYILCQCFFVQEKVNMWLSSYSAVVVFSAPFKSSDSCVCEFIGVEASISTQKTKKDRMTSPPS
jgi:hypothetical protein